MTGCDYCDGPIRVFNHVLDESFDPPRNYCGQYCQMKDRDSA